MWPQRVPAAPPGPLAAHRWLPVGIAGLVAYRDTPVGPYGEVFAALATLDRGRPLGHVPFMAVDSAASVAGGRGNWALPKELVRFDRGTVRGDGWAASITAAARPRTVPAAGTGRVRQAWEDGVLRDFLSRFRGRAGAASVTVAAVPGASLPTFLAAGAHPAVTLEGQVDVLAPQAA